GATSTPGPPEPAGAGPGTGLALPLPPAPAVGGEEPAQAAWISLGTEAPLTTAGETWLDLGTMAEGLVRAHAPLVPTTSFAAPAAVPLPPAAPAMPGPAPIGAPPAAARPAGGFGLPGLFAPQPGRSDFASRLPQSALHMVPALRAYLASQGGLAPPGGAGGA